MWSVAKAQLYQLKKDFITPLVFFGLLLLEAATMLIGVLTMINEHLQNPTMPEPTAGELFIIQLSMPFFGAVFAIVVTATFCCSDFSDKTLNYELMTGHRRSDSFFARALLSLAFGIGGAALLEFAPVCVLSAIYGWGENVIFRDAMLRGALVLLPVARLICEFVFISFLVKRRFAVMALGFVIIMLENSLPLFTESRSPLLAQTNINLLTYINAWSSFGLQGNIHVVYEAAIPARDVLLTVAASVGFGALFLFLGYVFFRHDDID